MSTATLDTTTVRRWKRYPEARALPLDWTLTLPAHWKIRRLKEVASVRPSNVDKKSVEGERAVQLCNYVDVYKNDKITADMEFMPATATEAQIAQFSIRAGDVIITKDSETWDDIAVPAYVPETIDGLVCGYHLALIRADTRCLNGAYLARCFAAEGLADQFRVAANGITRYGLDTQSVKCAVFPVPPLSEQRAIAAFLDRETARIDALIGQKERLIALLEEKRQAVISHAVTRGLDPSAPLKDSGIPWPMIKLSRLLRGKPKNGISPPIASDGGVPSFSVAAVRNGRVNIMDHIKYVELSPAEAQPYHVRAGDVYVMRGSGNISFVGTCGLVEDDYPSGCIYPDILIRLTPGPRLLAEFLVLSLNSPIGRRQIEVVAQTANGTWKVSGEDVAGLHVPVPDLAEQERVVREINRNTRLLSDSVASISDSMARLQEYRTALISAAVTGQIDVRGEVESGGPGA